MNAAPEKRKVTVGLAVKGSVRDVKSMNFIPSQFTRESLQNTPHMQMVRTLESQVHLDLCPRKQYKKRKNIER